MAAARVAPGDTGRLDALRAVERAIGREAHVLAERPDLTWQQLHNRLQWDRELSDLEARLDAERTRRSEADRPWWWLRTPPAEDATLIRRERAHTVPIDACAIGSDGLTIVTGSLDGNVRIDDLASGVMIRRWQGHESPITDCAPTPDGQWIVTASDDGTVKLWDAATGSHGATWPIHEGGATACVPTPDGRYVVSAGADRAVRVTEVGPGREVAAMAGHEVAACDVSPDGTVVASACADGLVRLWEVGSGREPIGLKGGEDGLLACAYSPDGELLATGGAKGSVRVWDVHRGIEAPSLAGHGQAVKGLAWTPDGRLLISGSDDGTLKVWDVASSSELTELRGHADFVADCAVAPNGRWLVSADWDGWVIVWDLWSATRASVTDTKAHLPHTGRVEGVSYAPDGRDLVSAGADHTLQRWDAESGEQRGVFGTFLWEYSDCTVSRDGRVIVSASRDSQLQVWDATTTSLLATLGASAPGVPGTIDGTVAGFESCAISPDGSMVAGTGIGAAVLWDMASGTQQHVLVGHSGWVNDCAFGPDGRWIVSAGADGTLRTWDTSSGRALATWAADGGEVAGCDVDPGGSTIVSASEDGSIRLWRSDTGQALDALGRHASRARACRFTPDGEYVASAGEDEKLRLWSLTERSEVATLPLAAIICSLDVHPSSPRAACGLWNGEVCEADLVGRSYGAVIAPQTGRGDTVLPSPAVRREAALAAVDRDSLMAFLGAGSWAQCRRVVEEHIDVLLARGTLDALGEMIEIAPNAAVLEDLVGHRRLLEQVRDEGLDRAFDAARGSPGEIFRARDRVDAAAATAIRADSSQEPPATAPVLPVPEPARPARSLADLIGDSGLRYRDVGGGSFAMNFASTRAERLVVHARTLDDGLAFLAVSLPGPGRFGGEAALRSLLGVSFRADYVKALVFPDGELAFACEPQLAQLTPVRLVGLVAGLAALGDVRKGDLADAAGWARRLATCRLAQADISLDPAAATAAIRSLAAVGGLPIEENQAGVLVVDLDLLGGGPPLRVVTRVGDRLVSMIAFLGDAKPKGDKVAYLRRMLQLNRAADIARLALDTDGDVALLFEVPEVGPDLFDRVSEQFRALLLGVLALERRG